MAKFVKEVNVEWTEGASAAYIVSGTTLFDHIFSVLQQASPDFVQVNCNNAAYPNDCYIYKDLKKTYNPGWYLYVEDGMENHYANARTLPAIFKKTVDEITRDSIPSFRIFKDNINVKNQKSFPMRISVYESKNKKCWAFSAVRASTTYDVWMGIIGIDSLGAAYAVAPNHSKQGLPIYCGVNDTCVKTFGTIPKLACTQQLGIGANSNALSLMPYINPANGAVCNDLYLPITGPSQTHVFDVTINGRNFVTAAFVDNGAILDDDTYRPAYRLFMEV